MKQLSRFILVYFLFLSCGKDKVAEIDLDAVEPVKTELNGSTTLYGLIVDQNNKPVENMVVSDGFSTAKTDANGVYQLERHKKAKFVFYVSSADVAINVDEDNYPMFYQKLVLKDKVIRHDFKVVKTDVEDKFTLFAIADPQCRNMSEVARFKNETMADIKTNISRYTNVIGLTLGDIVFDAPELLSEMKGAMSNQGIPFFQTIGNHDHLQTASSEDKSEEGFRNTFGPTYYSFDRANVHIVVVDNVIYEGKQSYRGGLTESHWKWLQSDLSHVSKDKMILFVCHIPFRNGSAVNHVDYYNEILDLLSTFKEAHILNGHTHYQTNYLHKRNGKTIYEHVHGTACGAWWNSTICADGTPNGYAVYEIEGNSMKNWKYKSTNYPDNFQLRVYDASQAFGPTNKYNYIFADSGNLNLSGDGWVVANVWNADDNWKIELFQNGVKVQDMTKKTSRDLWATYYHLETLGKTKGSDFDKSLNHFYVGKLNSPAGISNFEVRATDIFGNVYKATTLKTDFMGIGAY
ncbi:calcineurin-like phosphoesterase C-terminal domain-containing protein [Sphingobacterium faecale]|uniref:Calcineurin-like phosphoesterase C-terminal domain-containing protein n=1 Tax=Sphingobacterium faecale TaxID=2803775 RepID=A0ABS1R673_9SPHI|nr:calcineurin-like phosphoesterase family protein [Sphingobacterium faecale]MBL1410173.1 calcineurin-like phosphoesterase C-terminal domain-containing protein [Sphingobacterium faecale]